ncbi:hypothetical protein [Rhizobium etli]|uniref:Uncharacterized protein n=1 Tax=Rhizobium etli TaxID=29449 RepID=A0A7W6VHZ6_RHIET|nr:hypothetical protein [Rhizobium etli]MBB4483562.1 hypothetical protein [Rhizobium etli]MBB4539378.1 hypothetical protein [Rhizobium etli]
MLCVVKSLGKDDKTLLKGGRKPRHVLSEPSQSRNAILCVVKSLGEGDEALLEGGRKPCHASSQTLQKPGLMEWTKFLGAVDETLLEVGSKSWQARSEGLQSRGAKLCVLKSLGEDDEALLEGG